MVWVFVVPNGQYSISFTLGWGLQNGLIPQNYVWDNGLTYGPLWLEANGIGQVFDWAKQAQDFRTAATQTIPASVTDNLLRLAVRATGGQNTHSAPVANTIVITPVAPQTGKVVGSPRVLREPSLG
jgi:hypothetical protein